jgi:hypothetical protein
MAIEMIRRIKLVGAIATLVALAIAASDARASTVIGQVPPLAGGQAGCGNIDESVAQLAVSGGPSYIVPSPGGVITSWRAGGLDGDRDLALRVFTGDPSGTSFTPVEESQTETFPSGMNPSFPTQIRVSGGELLGLHIPVGPNVSGCIYVGAGGGNTWSIADSVMPVGQPETHTAIPDGRLNVSAVLEPDADHDGFGDETQDLCPADASTQGACPVTPVTTAPSVKKKKCKQHKKKHRSAESAKKKKCKKKKHRVAARAATAPT